MKEEKLLDLVARLDRDLAAARTIFGDTAFVQVDGRDADRLRDSIRELLETLESHYCDGIHSCRACDTLAALGSSEKAP